jgi:hypothetical protein
LIVVTLEIVLPRRCESAGGNVGMRPEGFVTAIRACGLAGGSVAKGMKKISYKGYRFPPEIIQQAIWLYVRFTLSFRAVEDLLNVASWSPTRPFVVG